MVVTVLGSGTPSLTSGRSGAAYLVEAGGQSLLIDAGRGTSVQLGKMGRTAGEIDAVFLTHFHSDHISGLADLFLSGYVEGSTARRREHPFHLIGPAGTSEIANGLRATYRWDIETRILDEGVPRVATQISADEYDSGIVYERDGLTVTMVPVLHGENIEPAVGYRVDYGGKSAVFSGDSTYDPALIALGQGTDLFIHELGMATAAAMANPTVQRIIAHHTQPAGVGRVFAQTQPRLAVLSHMVLLGSVPVGDVIDEMRSTYDGQIIVAEDLMQFILSDQGTTILIAKR